jgi:hypothetical protein
MKIRVAGPVIVPCACCLTLTPATSPRDKPHWLRAYAMEALSKENLRMKKIVLLLIGAATMLVAAGCEEGHEHHGNYGGAYDGNYRSYGHEQYPAREGNWERSDDWRPH